MALKGGSVISMGSLFVMLPAQKIGIAIVFNDIDYGKVQLLQNVMKLLLGAPTAPYQVAPVPEPLPASGYRLSPARAAEIAGVYDTRNGVMTVAQRGDTLAARFEGNDLTLEPTSDSTLVMRSVLREQEGQVITVRRCATTFCLWMRGDSSAVRR
jgi:hypothetical protein